MKLKAIIVEDEKTSRDILKNYISKYCPDVEVVDEASNVEEAHRLLENTLIDLLFLDVEMPYGTAFDLLDKLPNRQFETIFVTAYDQYAKEALNQQAAYYLLKPLEIDELIKAVSIVKQIKEKESGLTDDLAKTPTAVNTKINGKISIPTQEGFEILDVDQIVYCSADNNYTHIYLKNSKKLVSKTLRHFEDALEEYSFCRIHKSHLINPRYVTAYHKGKGGSVKLGTTELPVSASRKLELFKYFA
ncbi:MAG: LytTR family DNA-binding domain-containing protein [Nonlabens sp.]